MRPTFFEEIISLFDPQNNHKILFQEAVAQQPRGQEYWKRFPNTQTSVHATQPKTQTPTTPDFCIPVLEVLARRTKFKPNVGIEGTTKLKDEILRYMGIDPENPPIPLRGRNPKGLYRRIYLAFWNLCKDKGGRSKQFSQYRKDIDPGRSFFCQMIEDKKTGKALWALNWAGVDAVIQRKKLEWEELLNNSAQIQRCLAEVDRDQLKKVAPRLAALQRLYENTPNLNVTSIWMQQQNYSAYRAKLEAMLAIKCKQSRDTGRIAEHAQDWDTLVLDRDRFRKQLLKRKGAGVSIPPSKYAAWGCQSTFTSWRDNGQDAAMRALHGCKTQTERAREEEHRKRWEPYFDEKQGVYVDPSQNLGMPVFPSQMNQTPSPEGAPVTYSAEEDGSASIRDFVDTESMTPEDEFAMNEAIQNIELVLQRKLRRKAPKHIKVAILLASGSSTQEIADALRVTPKEAKKMITTVRTTLADLRPE